MIRIAIVDDHPALRAGLRTVIDAEPGLVFAGESNGQEESLWPLLRRTRPDLVLLDYHLPESDGLQLCYRIKRQITPPKVLVYSAYASPALALPARIAGADGVIDKGLAARDLFEAIRLVYGGEQLLADTSQFVLREAMEQLEDGDRPIVGLMLDGSNTVEIAEVLRMSPDDVEHAVRRILAALSTHVRT
jgi:DNA-binding NarL/FixJ family response regulator